MWEVLTGRVVSPIPDWHFIPSCYGRTENAQDRLKQSAAFIHLSYLLSKGGELCFACRQTYTLSIYISFCRVCVSLCECPSFSLSSPSMCQHTNTHLIPPSLPPSLPPSQGTQHTNTYPSLPSLPSLPPLGHALPYGEVREEEGRLVYVGRRVTLTPSLPLFLPHLPSSLGDALSVGEEREEEGRLVMSGNVKYSPIPPSLPPSLLCRARTTGWRSTGRGRTIGPCPATSNITWAPL